MSSDEHKKEKQSNWTKGTPSEEGWYFWKRSNSKKYSDPFYWSVFFIVVEDDDQDDEGVSYWPPIEDGKLGCALNLGDQLKRGMWKKIDDDF